MKVLGIIVEYNPFHNGHKYHLDRSIDLIKPDLVIAVMSGNFVQRGEVSIINKKERVEEALRNKVDLVIELPLLYCVENADIFAKYALSILNHLKVSHICFGSETGDTSEFIERFDNTSILTPHLDFLVNENMAKGFAYPKAMSMALMVMDQFRLEKPNDILGLAYYREIKKNNYPIKIETIKREQDYHSLNLKDKYPSASAIRHSLKANEEVSSYSSMGERFKKAQLMFNDDLFDFLRYKIISTSSEELEKIHLVSEGIENLFKKNINKTSSLEEFINLCASKRYTFARIKRTLIHILLNTKKEDANKFLSKDVSYIRVLGMNKKGQLYLNKIKKEVEVPILSRFKGKSFTLLQYEFNSSMLLDLIYKNTNLAEQEINSFPVIIE